MVTRPAAKQHHVTAFESFPAIRLPADAQPQTGLKVITTPAVLAEPMSLDEITQATVAFVREDEIWGAPLVFVLALGESLAFISLLLPATVILFAVGALIGTSGIAFWPIWTAAALGAALGDWFSFWVGLKLKGNVAHLWPLSRNPDLIPRGHRFFERWGALGVFVGRFFGPFARLGASRGWHL
jgi:membrane protein YqaA with SNARE-associated domain